MPSARNATFTPAPVKPSDRAVFAPFAEESVWVSARPSGSSCGAAEHAPGGAFSAVACAAVLFTAVFADARRRLPATSPGPAP